MTSLEVEIYDSVLTEELHDQLTKWLKGITFSSKIKRTTKIYGDSGLIYEMSYKNYQTGEQVFSKRPAIVWPTILNKVKELLQELIGVEFNFAAIMCYPNGNAFISPHKDKEVKDDALIVGLSIGETRTLKFQRYNYDSVEIPLHDNSLYVIKPPTNDIWSHSIPKCDVKGVRYSLTFRNIL